MSANVIHRPDPARWIWYVYGGTLPARYRTWVLHDLTAGTRWWRQVARTTATMVPLAVLGLTILGPTWITWAAIGGGLSIALIYAAAYIDQSAEHRLGKHGYPMGTLAQKLDEAHADTNAIRRQRYNSTYRRAA